MNDLLGIHMDPITYQIYETYSTQFIINIDSLNTFIIQNKIVDQCIINQWVINNSFYIIKSISIPNFAEKISHNLDIAKKTKNSAYVQYIRGILNINIDMVNWTYTPCKIKIHIKSHGFCIDQQLSELLGIDISSQKKFKHFSDIIKLIHKYIYDNELQNRYDRQCLTPDDKLLKLLTPTENNVYTYFNLNDCIKSHITSN